MSILGAISVVGGLTGGSASTIGTNQNSNSIVGIVGGLGANWGSNISAIIESGFNFSCWGSTHKPADGKRYLSTDIPKIMEQTGINSVFSQRALDLTIKYLKYYAETCHAMAGRFNKCSKQTLSGCGNTANTALENLIASMGQSIEFVENRAESVVLPFTASIKEEEFTKARLIQYPVYRIKSNDSTGNVSGTPAVTIGYDSETGSTIVKPAVVSSNVFGLVALAGIGYVFMNKDGKKKKKRK